MAKSKISFEDTMDELEKIVDLLESGDAPLEEAMDLFQKGVELSKICSKKLDEIEKRVTLLIENENGKIIEKEFELGGSNGFQ